MRQQLGCRPPVRFALKVEIGQLLPGVIRHDESGVAFVDRPGRREAAGMVGHPGARLRKAETPIKLRD